MRTTKWNLTVGLGCLLIANLACNFSVSTANMSSLKLGKDEKITQEASSPADTIYAVATISNAPGKVKVKGRLAFEDVPGEQTGPIPGLEKTLDCPAVAQQRSLSRPRRTVGRKENSKWRR